MQKYYQFPSHRRCKLWLTQNDLFEVERQSLATEMGDRRLFWSRKILSEISLQLSTKIKAIPEVELRREVLGWLIAARSSHGHFADYPKRFSHNEQDLHCDCSRRCSQLHLFSCPNARVHRPKLWCRMLKRHFTPEKILGTPEGVRTFAEWAPSTELLRGNRSQGDQEEN